jgi:hypothetical protein
MILAENQLPLRTTSEGMLSGIMLQAELDQPSRR